MVQATTPTFILTLPQDVDLSLAHNVYFTITQGKLAVTKSGEDLSIDENEVSVFMPQEETVLFAAGQCSLQLNWTYQNGERCCTNIVTVEVQKNLVNEVLE